MGGPSSRFDLQLDPHGLGKVDVSVEIGADGRLAARLNFDNAQAASDLRGRAQDLRQALEQAGFSLGEGSLSFDFAGQNRDPSQGFDDSARTGQAGRAFARAMDALEDEAVLPVRYQARSGLDLLI
ncbi:MAG: flagellar hook-length control protein FliK [Caulobacter sp.]|nr:flagellar hook-length control protein FliK [Caulobacter sp.]